MQHTNAVRKPVGGFVFITVRQLCRVWIAYRQRRIRLVDVWVWWAAHEVVAQRCQARPDQKRCYRVEELDRLVGSAHSMPQSLRRLAQAGVLSWDEDQITFPEEATSMDERAALNAMLEQIPNHERRVPMPRRIIRYVASGCRRVTIATILGHLLRCLYYRAGHCYSDGYCKAPWIAKVFGVGLRQVKRARQQLKDLGLLQRHETPQWALNHYGVDLTINLQWDGPPHDDNQNVTPFLPVSSSAASPPGLIGNDSAAVPAVLTLADAQASTQAVREHVAEQQETPVTRTLQARSRQLARVAVEVDGQRASDETRQHALPSTSGRFDTMFEQVRADVRAGRLPRAEVYPHARHSDPLANRPRASMHPLPLMVATSGGVRTEETPATTLEPLPTQPHPLVHNSSEADQHRLHQEQGEQRAVTRTESCPPEFHPIQTVLSTLQLPTVEALIVDQPRSADAVRAGAGAELCNPVGQTARKVTLTPFATPYEMTPPGEPKPATIAPPDSDRKLSQREEENQKPATRGGAGILSALVLQARAEVKAGVGARSTQAPVLNPSDAAPLNTLRASRGDSTLAGAPAKQSGRTPSTDTVKPKALPIRQTSPAILPPPTLRHILVQDLRETERLLQLYKQAVTAGVLSLSEADRLNFVALAQHVLSYRPENPGGLFTQLLRQRRFDYITQDDEDAAQRRLKWTLYGGALPVLCDATDAEQREAG